MYFNVPAGFEAIASAMQTDLALRRNLLSRVKMFFYAGAGLSQPVWDSLSRAQEAELGQRVVMTTALGMTESGPFACSSPTPTSKRATWVYPPRAGNQAGSHGRQDRTALPWPQHHTRLLARPAGNRQAFR